MGRLRRDLRGKQKNISSYSLQRSCVQRRDPWGLKGLFLLKEKNKRKTKSQRLEVTLS